MTALVAEQWEVWNHQTLHFSWLELCQTPSIGATAGRRHVDTQVRGEGVEIRVAHGFPRVDSVSDVDVTGIDRVPHERGRPPRHVGRQDGCRRGQADAPPCASIASHVAVGDTEPLRFAQEAIDSLPVGFVEDVQIGRKADDCLEAIGG